MTETKYMTVEEAQAEIERIKKVIERSRQKTQEIRDAHRRAMEGVDLEAHDAWLLSDDSRGWREREST